MMLWFFDYYYIVLVVPAVIFTMIVSARVKSTFNKYSKQFSSRNLTGSAAAQRVLSANGINNVSVERIQGDLTDHYDPKTNVIRLSEKVYDSTSTAAIGVACHEAGHAIQHATGYAPIKIRNAIVPITNIGSTLSMPLILIGLMFAYRSDTFISLSYIGVALFSLSVIFQLVTLPTEFNASRRAIKSIEQTQILDSQEIVGAKKVLSAAAMTYVGALAVSLMQLLRLLLIVGRNNRR